MAAMHEMSLAQGVVTLLEEQAAARAFERVRVVWLEIGALSHVQPEALAFCFDAVTRGTLAEGARLEILRVPGRGWCIGCSTAVAMGSRVDPCPRCGSFQVEVTEGDEMRVKELEVI
jgi:hydrogenase nickel incorporation protein HypA/HybF